MNIMNKMLYSRDFFISGDKKYLVDTEKLRYHSDSIIWRVGGGTVDYCLSVLEKALFNIDNKTLLSTPNRFEPYKLLPREVPGENPETYQQEGVPLYITTLTHSFYAAIHVIDEMVSHGFDGSRTLRRVCRD